MALIDDIKISLRITNTAYNTEITDLINAAKADLLLSGVLVTSETDVLIKRCINLYVKAHFGYNNPDSEKLKLSYDLLKIHLGLSGEYSFYTLTFTITDSVTTNPIQETKIKLFNVESNYEKIKYTNVSGVVTFNVPAKSNYKYDITATDYESDLHEEDDKNIIDVSTNTSVSVALVGV